jgi:hypothetical protein
VTWNSLPLPLINGIDKTSTAAPSIFLGKEAHSRRSQHLADKNNGQPFRAFADHLSKSHLKVGAAQRLHTADLHDVFATFLLDSSGKISAGDDTEHVLFLIQCGHRQHAMLRH